MTSPSRAGHAVPRAGQHHTDLVRLLTALKDRSALTFAELAARTTGSDDTAAVSVSTLKRAVDSRAIPREHVVTAFARACGASTGDERAAMTLWQAARAEHRGILATLRAPSVARIRTPADFNTALAAAYERAGAPPLRVLQNRATTATTDGALLLPTTTLWRITRREAHAATWPQCEAYLRALGAHPYARRLWYEAFTRVRNPASSNPADSALTRATNLARLSRLHYSTKISARFKTLLNRMTPQEIETALTVGTAYLTTENLRPAITPTTYDHITGVGQELFLPPAPAHQVATAAPADNINAPEGKTFLSPAVKHFIHLEARRNGSAPDTGIDAPAPVRPHAPAPPGHSPAAFRRLAA